MVYLLYGPDTFSRNKNATELMEGVVVRNPDVIRKTFDFSGDENQLFALYDFITTPSLFSGGKRLALVQDALPFFSHPVFGEILKHSSKNQDCILVCNESFEKKEIGKKERAICEAHGVVVHFYANPTESAIEKKIQLYAKSHGIAVSAEALDFLISYYGADMYAVITDLEKWAVLHEDITLAFLKKAGHYGKTVGVFDFSQALLFKKPLAERLKLFEYILSQGTDLYAAFNIVAKMTSSGTLISSLADLDIRVKRGLLDMDQAMTVLVLFS